MNRNAGNVGYRWALSALATVLMALAGASSASAGVADREADPIVLTGAQAPGLIGIAPNEVVAFRWNGAWKQIPVQVDERKIADYRVIRQMSRGSDSKELKTEAYADPNTYAGADGVAQMTTTSPSVPVPGTIGDPNLDQDDEIAVMSKDSGASAAGKPDPAGVDGTTRTPVRIKDPLGTGTVNYFYLFRKTADLDPAAGTDYVSYRWKFEPALIPGYFKEAGVSGPGYDFDGIDDLSVYPPANPEASSVETSSYSQTFPGKWLVEGMKITKGAATGGDILDGDKSIALGPAGCSRNELTFSRGGGGFIAAIDGPVRAIRSYIGANSGTFTQRDQIYYQDQVQTTTYLRVHPGIGNLILAADYSQKAFSMIYRNSLNPNGVEVDGVPDDVAKGELSWEQVSGVQGSVTQIARVTTDIPITATSYYQDNLSPPAGDNSILCSGDDHAIGASGPWVKGTEPYNTDPTRTEPLKHLTADRTTYIDPPDTAKEEAIHHSQQVDSPLVISTGAGTDPTVPITDPDPDPPGTPGRTNWVGLKVRVLPSRMKAGIGDRKVFRVKVRNVGDLLGKKVKVCPKARDRLVRTSRCKKLKKLRPGKSAGFRFRARLRRAAAGKRKVRVRFRAKAAGSKARGSSGVMLTTPFRR
ncbi:MAG: hypothetical protein IPK93_00760 [Solirubrobacterales bacterium]|nr:hypothetical protein [Solirubrobacterales bacterium]